MVRHGISDASVREQPLRLPVSVKGVIPSGSRAVLLENERGEWELPGGKLESGESLQSCLAREIEEELNLRVEIGPVLDVRVCEVVPDTHVLIVSYSCFVENFDGIFHNREHSDVALFGVEDLDGAEIPPVYREAINAWLEHTSEGSRP